MKTQYAMTDENGKPLSGIYTSKKLYEISRKKSKTNTKLAEKVSDLLPRFQSRGTTP